MDKTELAEVPVPLDPRVLLDKTVILVQSVQPDLQDLPAIQVRLELRDRLDQLVIQDRKARKVRMGPLDPLEREEIPEMQALQDQMDSPGWLAHPARQEVKVQLAVQGRRDLPERLVSRGHRERQDSRVPQDLQVIQVRLETQVRRVHRERRDQLDHLELMVSRVNQGRLAARE